MRILTFLLLIFSLNLLYAQDTLRVMHYNLLYYGENTGFCNFTNNNPDLKDVWLRTIIGYTKPDIFTVNEMSEQTTYHTRVLTEVMNQAGYAQFEMAASPKLAESRIVNQLYYNTEKLALHSQDVTVSIDSIRDIDIYSLYHLDEGLLDGDTIFIHCIVAHLKAGSASSDEIKRKTMTEDVLDYLEAHGRPGNYLFMGDFNLYDADEAAFQLMITNNDPVFRFYDPVDEIGDWHDNPSFRHVHTQSTHTNSGCHSSGGMDDRFDFILMNEVINEAADRLYYLEDTYHALGQDGIRLNGSLLEPPNTSLPAYILDALYGMSDHLPVIMDLVVEEPFGVDETHASSQMKVTYNNPVKDVLTLRTNTQSTVSAKLRLFSTSGGLVYQEQIILNPISAVTIILSKVPSGFYILRIDSDLGIFSGKLVIIN